MDFENSFSEQNNPSEAKNTAFHDLNSDQANDWNKSPELGSTFRNQQKASEAFKDVDFQQFMKKRDRRATDKSGVQAQAESQKVANQTPKLGAQQENRFFTNRENKDFGSRFN